jgi:hypothetical protein
MQSIEKKSISRNGRAPARQIGGSPAPAVTSAHSLPAAATGLLRKGIVSSAAAMLVFGASGVEATYNCLTGAVDVSAISQEQFEQTATEAGENGCVTPEGSGVTVCQLIPMSGSDLWTVVAQAPEGGGVAGSAVELEVMNGRNCLFNANTPLENTEARWIQALSDFATPESPRPLDFIAVVQIGPGSQTTAAVCPLNAPDDPAPCQQWSGWD